MDHLIYTEEITKIYNPHKPDEMRALEGVSVQINRGEVVVLKGPSGSGKTTLLSLIGCMGRPTSGRIVVEDRDVAKLPERFLTAIRRSTFGFIFQQFNLLRNVSVIDNVLLPLYPVDIDVPTMQQRADGLMEKLGIGGKKQLRVKQLSGGEQQRVAIARALINEPTVIIADEPTAHLDRQLAADLLVTLEHLNREGKTIIIATHDPLVYEHPFITKIIEMRDGRIEGVTQR